MDNNNNEHFRFRPEVMGQYLTQLLDEPGPGVLGAGDYVISVNLDSDDIVAVFEDIARPLAVERFRALLGIDDTEDLPISVDGTDTLVSNVGIIYGDEHGSYLIQRRLGGNAELTWWEGFTKAIVVAEEGRAILESGGELPDLDEDTFEVEGSQAYARLLVSQVNPDDIAQMLFNAMAERDFIAGARNDIDALLAGNFDDDLDDDLDDDIDDGGCA